MRTSRRTLVKASGAGALVGGGLLLPLGSRLSTKSISTLSSEDMPRPYRAVLPRQAAISPDYTTDDDDGGRTDHYTITQRPGVAAIVPGLLTTVHGYNGQFPGPLMKVERGTRVRLRVRNQLPRLYPGDDVPFDTSTHLHGAASKPQYDGYANDLCRRGQVKTYHFDNIRPARTLWYHDHAVHRTSQNVYAGLVGQYHIHDEVERALLPQGSFDVPLTLGDAIFTESGQLSFQPKAESGLWGDVILVNGAPWPRMSVQRRVYRFRLLNASVSRSYRLRLSNGAPVHMVATDGGLMPQSQTVSSWRHGVAERYEFLIDFRGYAPGTRIALLNASNKNNVDYDNTNKVMRFDVTDEPVDTTDPTWSTIPDLLASSETMTLTEADSIRRRRWRLEHDDVTSEFSIGGFTWRDVEESGFTEVMANPDLDDVEVWEFQNGSGGWHHPIHIHLIDFKILSRNGRPAFPYERGPKDVVFVGEGETVRLLCKFGPRTGRYMVHCHNLPHEDFDMMSQFRVGPAPDGQDPDDPIWGDPAVDDPDHEEDD